ncbi:cysteate synthase [Kitasatospora sp. RG8]|uniref:cysteate synthase n=1 Tax=Kitasatospora sp. RG8 TaxID=2820815 RepID=UPI001AE07785|nr:cysteate synthase [Kitasatospora sp. RG8]MBP0453544.1 cysteate synthase [Kitasatospora sp. RG8]
MDPGDPYLIACTGCDWRSADDGLRMSCPRCGDGSLLRTEYATSSFTVAPEASGVFRYRSWLPVRREIEGSSRPAVYRSEGLGRELGLTDLWVSFSGYWPERGCRMVSGSFKELEAYTVLGRTPQQAGVMVVASAGNTAAAFAAAHGPGVPRLLVVPDRAAPVVAAAGGCSADVRVVALRGATYNDVIDFSRKLVASTPGFFPEGGVRNVARRDGLGVIALTAFEEMGTLPEFYVQAVGSGAGAIATYEASERILASGAAAGQSVPRMLLCQNADFAPLGRAWRGEPGPADGGAQADPYAPELANSTPPYDVHGGVRDILRATAGDVLVADRAAAQSARAMFEELEGIDIEPAAAVAVAALRDAVRSGRLPRDARCLLNVTGGGRRRLHATTTAGGAPEAGATPESAGIRSVGPTASPDEVAAAVLDSFASGRWPLTPTPVGC